MKYLIIIATLLAGYVSKVVAQEKPITVSEVVTEKNLNYKEYKIKANKDLEIKVNVIRKKEENLTVFILDKQKNIIARRENLKEGENKFTFEIDNEDEYTLKITNCQPFKLEVQLAQN